MLEDFFHVIGVSGKAPVPTYWRVQLWGAAVPQTALEGLPASVWDPWTRVGICGDWLSGSSMQCAYNRLERLGRTCSNWLTNPACSAPTAGETATVVVARHHCAKHGGDGSWWDYEGTEWPMPRFSVQRKGPGGPHRQDERDDGKSSWGNGRGAG